MNAETKISEVTGLAKLREPFPDNQIGKLPKGTKAQNDCPPGEKINCKVCGGWHHPKIVHLDYVGHAAITARLLDADPMWAWEPMALKDGLPAFDSTGGLWIKLTVCGHTRIGYGNAAQSPYKDIGSREKEVIGDALRNAVMRFGSALELWHKGELYAEEEEIIDKKEKVKKQKIEECSAEAFAELKTKFYQLIKSGDKTASGLIDWLSAKTILTEDQIMTISSWAHEGDQ